MTHFKATVSSTGKLDLKKGEAVTLNPPTSVGTAKSREKKFGPLADVI